MKDENYNVAERIKEVSINNLKNALHKGIVEFSYRKKNGEVRTARGTLSTEIMGEENAPNGNGYNVPDNTVRYYDINSKGWRSFIIENYIGMTIE